MEEKGYQVYIPELPTPDKPNLELTWDMVKDNFDSSNDPFVQLRHGGFLERELGGKRITLSGAKHFSVFTAGEKWRQFPEILEYI